MEFETMQRVLSTAMQRFATINAINQYTVADGGHFENVNRQQSRAGMFKHGEFFIVFDEKIKIDLCHDIEYAYVCYHKSVITWLYESEIKFIND